MTDTLTDRQLRFVFEYLIDQNASAAAVRAGYSEKSRASQANELMKNEAVRERIRIELSSLLAEAQCSELQLIMERKRAAFFRAERMFASGWEVLPLDGMEEETRRALEVSTVMRKSGPVIRVKQPDRDKALRALEKVHERLERLNERYYEKLEREGRVPSLEEIEAMDGGGVQAAAEIAEKSSVFSGFGESTAPEGGLRAKGGELKNVEKPMVLSGSAAGAGALAVQFPANTMVLSGGAGQPALPDEAPGRPQDCYWLLREPLRSPGQLRVA